jgi:hypothetical protein
MQEDVTVYRVDEEDVDLLSNAELDKIILIIGKCENSSMRSSMVLRSVRSA